MKKRIFFITIYTFFFWVLLGLILSYFYYSKNLNVYFLRAPLALALAIIAEKYLKLKSKKRLAAVGIALVIFLSIGWYFFYDNWFKYESMSMNEKCENLKLGSSRSWVSKMFGQSGDRSIIEIDGKKIEVWKWAEQVEARFYLGEDAVIGRKCGTEAFSHFFSS